MNEQAIAFTQLGYIISKLDKSMKEKIPVNLIRAIYKKRDKSYIFHYDKTLPLDKQDLLPETKSLLSVIYSEYICSENEKEKWDEYDRYKKELINKQMMENKNTKTENKQEIQASFNFDDIFSNTQSNQVNISEKMDGSENTKLIKVENSIFRKMWNKILSIFKK